MYLLYSFYFKQPSRPKVRIKLSYEEFQDLSSLMEEAKREAHSDVLYAWSKLILTNAFQYSVVGGPKGLEVAKAMEKGEGDNMSGIEHSSSYFRSNEFKSMMKRLGKAHNTYVNIKKSMIKEPDAGYSLSAIDDKFMDDINEVTWSGVSMSSGSIGGLNEIGEKRKKLKEKFFETVHTEAKPRFIHDESESEEDESWLPEVSEPSPKQKKKAVKKTKKSGPVGKKSGPVSKKSGLVGKKSGPNAK